MKEILPLTSRELDVLRLLAEEGITDKEIADRLGVSIKTMRKHKEHIFQKLGVHNRLQAVITALHYGLIDMPVNFSIYADAQERSFR